MSSGQNSIKSSLEKAEETVKRAPVAQVPAEILAAIKPDSVLKKEQAVKEEIQIQELRITQFRNKLKFYGAAFLVAMALFIGGKYLFGSSKVESKYVEAIVNQVVNE